MMMMVVVVVIVVGWGCDGDGSRGCFSSKEMSQKRKEVSPTKIPQK